MKHSFSLCPVPFELIKSEHKKIEMRLLDKKRSLLKVGDTIVFIHSETKEEIVARICDLKDFDSFEELYKNYSMIELGYGPNEVADHEDMLIYYSEEKQRKFRALAIRIELEK